jgi:hypothetical protein
MRISVELILSLLAQEASDPRRLPGPEADDIRACSYAHTVIA